jgi:hypothetical protein
MSGQDALNIQRGEHISDSLFGRDINLSLNTISVLAFWNNVLDPEEPPCVRDRDLGHFLLRYSVG